MIDRTTGESFAPESIEVRKFGLLSYEDVKALKDMVEYVTAEFIHCDKTYVMLYHELKAELELRG